jgi:predicted transcriptional regulator
MTAPGSSTPGGLEVPPPLHELEAEVMNEAWRHERMSVRELMERLNRRARPPRAYTTYMTVMSRLDTKGLLSREREGKTDFYSPTFSRDEYRALRAQAEVKGLVREFGDVALAQFARQMDQLEPKQLEELRRLASGD